MIPHPKRSPFARIGATVKEGGNSLKEMCVYACMYVWTYPRVEKKKEGHVGRKGHV
jgi:hypothetical protein